MLADVDYDDDPTRNPFYELLKKMEREQKEAISKNFIMANKIKYSKADTISPEQLMAAGFNTEKYLLS